MACRTMQLRFFKLGTVLTNAFKVYCDLCHMIRYHNTILKIFKGVTEKDTTTIGLSCRRNPLVSLRCPLSSQLTGETNEGLALHTSLLHQLDVEPGSIWAGYTERNRITKYIRNILNNWHSIHRFSLNLELGLTVLSIVKLDRTLISMFEIMIINSTS